MIRLAGTVAIVTGLVMSSGIAAATQMTAGLSECDQDNCAVVTMNDLKLAQAQREITVYRPLRFPADRFSPHLIP